MYLPVLILLVQRVPHFTRKTTSESKLQNNCRAEIADDGDAMCSSLFSFPIPGDLS